MFSVGGGEHRPPVSVNLVESVQLAKAVGASVVGVVGRDGGDAAQLADACIVVPDARPRPRHPADRGPASAVWHLIVSHPDAGGERRPSGRASTLPATQAVRPLTGRRAAVAVSLVPAPAAGLGRSWPGVVRRCAPGIGRLLAELCGELARRWDVPRARRHGHGGGAATWPARPAVPAGRSTSPTHAAVPSTSRPGQRRGARARRHGASIDTASSAAVDDTVVPAARPNGSLTNVVGPCRDRHASPGWNGDARRGRDLSAADRRPGVRGPDSAYARVEERGRRRLHRGARCELDRPASPSTPWRRARPATSSCAAVLAAGCRRRRRGALRPTAADDAPGPNAPFRDLVVYLVRRRAVAHRHGCSSARWERPASLRAASAPRSSPRRCWTCAASTDRVVRRDRRRIYREGRRPVTLGVVRGRRLRVDRDEAGRRGLPEGGRAVARHHREPARARALAGAARAPASRSPGRSTS